MMPRVQRTLAALSLSTTLVFLAVGMGATHAADHWLAYAAISNASCGLVAVSRLPSPFLSAEVDFPVVAIIATLLAYRRWRRGEDWRAPLWIVVALLLATAVEFAAKHLVSSPTPSQMFGPVSSREDCGGEGYGLTVVETPFAFPSGSVMRLAFLCALAVEFVRPRLFGFGLVVASVPIAASRVPIGWHWPSDLIGGFVVGTLAACAALAAVHARARAPAVASACPAVSAPVPVRETTRTGTQAGP